MNHPCHDRVATASELFVHWRTEKILALGDDQLPIKALRKMIRRPQHWTIDTEGSQVRQVQRSKVYAAVIVMLLGMNGCTVIGVGVGAVAGSGTGVGMLGGAVIGGVIGHEIGK